MDPDEMTRADWAALQADAADVWSEDDTDADILDDLSELGHWRAERAPWLPPAC